MSDNIVLTDDQKALITRKINEGVTDYVILAGIAFGNTDLTGRSLKAKCVRDFMVQTGILAKPKTDHWKTHFDKKPRVFGGLSAENMEFIDQNIKLGISLKNITQILFNQDFQGAVDLKLFLTPQYKAVLNYVRDKHPDFVPDSESGIDETYAIPRIIGTVIKKVNKWTGKNLEESNLSMKDRRCLEKLLLYLQSPRFVQNYNSYSSNSDKELFESEFVRATFDKADLTIDEINLYINTCMDYINLKQIDSKKNKINKMFEETDGQQDMSMRLAEMLKTVSEEYNQTASRIDKSLQKLNGERAKRIASIQQSNASILNLVELFQDEQERNMMIRQAELQKKLIGEEADKLESMSAWKARVLGISKEDAI